MFERLLYDVCFAEVQMKTARKTWIHKRDGRHSTSSNLETNPLLSTQ